MTRRGVNVAGAAVLLSLLAVCGSGCRFVPYDPEQATRPYPRHLHQAGIPADIEVFREGNTVRLVNATVTSFGPCDLWINQRYMQRLDGLPAGQTVLVRVNDFWDHWGNGPNRDGILRRYKPTPIRLAELQVSDSAMLVGLVAIRSETIDLEDAQQRRR